MDDEDLWDLMDELELGDNKNISEPSSDKCCDKQYLIWHAGTEICENCGQGCFKKQQIVYTYNDGIRTSGPQLYKRISYFKHKIELLNAYQYPFDGCSLSNALEELGRHPLIIEAKKAFQGKTEKEIIGMMIEVRFMYGLRQVLKLIGKSKLYKFMFLIINRLFHITCFEISREMVITLARQWSDFEYRFKIGKKGRKNSYSYNVFLQHILKKNGIPYFELITLPINHVKVRKEIAFLM
jgi:hypothetical protein